MGQICVRIEWSGRHIFGEESIRHAMIQQYGLDFTVSKLPPPAVEKWCTCTTSQLYKLGICSACGLPKQPAPDKCELKLPEKVNLPVFVHDYFKQGTWTGEALQALNDHIGLLEKAHNDLLDYLSQKGR